MKPHYAYFASVFLPMIEQRKIKGSNKNKFSNTNVYSVENHDEAQITHCFAFAMCTRVSQMMFRFFWFFLSNGSDKSLSDCLLSS